MLLLDDGRHLIRLAGDGVEGQVLRRLADPEAAVRRPRHQPLVDLLRHLEAIGIVVPDEPVRGVQDGLR